MLRNIWKPALALGAVLAVSGAASAGDTKNTTLLSGGTGPSTTTMTLGGSGTASQAATEDNELTHGYRGRYYGGGYRGWGGGWGGYRGGYWGGYRGGYWGGYRGYYSGFYRPYFSVGYYGGYYRPAYYYSRSYYTSYPVYTTYYDCDPCSYLGISGGSASGAPAVNLGSNFAQPVPMAQPIAPNDGTYRYDGGPSNPIPQPLPDAKPIPPASPSPTATDLPISGKSKSPFAPSTTPYKYKAYGEK